LSNQPAGCATVIAFNDIIYLITTTERGRGRSERSKNKSWSFNDHFISFPNQPTSRQRPSTHFSPPTYEAFYVARKGWVTTKLIQPDLILPGDDTACCRHRRNNNLFSFFF